MPFRRKHAMDAIEALAGHRAGRLTLVDVRGPWRSSARAAAARRWSATAARRAGLDARIVAGGMAAWGSCELDTTMLGGPPGT